MLSRALLKAWFNKQLAGYTGDCLGAAQIFSELAIYLTVLAYFHYVDMNQIAGVVYVG